MATREALIARKIITIRDERVILDVHLAEFYGVETRVLKQAVRRNKDRFPDDFMYELSDAEIDDVVSHFVILSATLRLSGQTMLSSFLAPTLPSSNLDSLLLLRL